MNLLIAGGSGFIGHYLASFLAQKGHNITILSRSFKKSDKPIHTHYWDGTVLSTDFKVDIIVNLCGQNIANRRWSKKVKQELLQSRLNPTNAIVRFIKNYPSEIKPRLLNASAIGFYPNSQEIQTEDHYMSSSKTRFSKDLITQWEACAQKATAYNASVTCLRFGVVLGKMGGMLNKIVPVFKLGLGTIMGDKKASLSWIHIHDLCQAILFIMSLDKPKLVYNITSPQPCTQWIFAKTLAKFCNRPCFLYIPQFFIKFFLGQMGKELLLANQKIYPGNLKKAHFNFKYQNIEKALNNILNQ